ncbi:MAG: type II toxin-antitoxin system RelE/ParE family toxin [Salinivirgaceae bacterium]|nr:type II toxin-antitoxin system RelE/ParE family toxin [Salinivirgaceae bacterium]
MALEIIWSIRAEKGFDKIVNYIEENWTEREIKNFMQESQEFFELLKKNPKMLQPSSKTNLYRGPINHLTMITYKIRPKKKQIVLVNIRSTKQKPMK